MRPDRAPFLFADLFAENPALFLYFYAFSSREPGSTPHPVRAGFRWKTL
jgi:hypothetical protein